MRREAAISCRLRMIGPVAVLLALACAPLAARAGPESDPASALQARHAALSEQLEHSPFPQHLHVESREGSGAAQGDVYAVVDYPIATVSEAFSSPANWCDALILHLDVKYCRRIRTTTDGAAAALPDAAARPAARAPGALCGRRQTPRNPGFIKTPREFHLLRRTAFNPRGTPK